MATTTTHAPGTFCWPELATSDYAGAKKFYTGLFGWAIQEQDMGGGEMYGIFTINGADVCAIYKMRPPEAAHGTPPHWNSYVAVANADQSAAKAKELGATVVMEPFDVMDLGRMAVIQDPTGAMFCIWQAMKKAGAGVLGEPGALCWTELMTTDTRQASRFYTALLPWTAEKMPMAPMDYTLFKLGDRGTAGMVLITPEMGKVPPNWLPYIQVADCDATAKQCETLGGKIAVPAQTVPTVGRFAVLIDPQGAHIAIIQPMPA